MAPPRRRLRGPRRTERRQFRYLVGVPLGGGALGVGTLGAALTGRWALVRGPRRRAWSGWESDFWGYLRREEGLPFALACVPLMAIERTTVAVAVIAGTVDLAWTFTR